MASKHEKRVQRPWLLPKCKSRARAEHFTLTRMTAAKNRDHAHYSRQRAGTGSLTQRCWECKTCLLCTTVCWDPENIDIELPRDPAIPPLGLHPRELENTRSHKNLFTGVHSSIICNRPKVEAAQIPVNGCMDKYSAVHPCAVECLAAEGEGRLMPYNADGNIVLSERS